MSDEFSHIPAFFRERVEMLFEINRRYAESYSRQLPSLNLYKAKHPTQIVIFKCSDGRLLFSRYAQMPLGFLETFRNLGGKFNWGWIGLKESFKGIVRDGQIEYLERKQNQSNEEQLKFHREQLDLLASLQVQISRDSGADINLCLDYEPQYATLVIVTYHKSKGSNETRGCKALEFDIDEGIKNAKGFRMSIEKAHKSSKHKVIVVVFGMETDEEFYVLHGENGQVRDLGDADKYPEDITDSKIFALICDLYPSMPLQMKLDLLPVLRGNIRHGWEIRRSNRTAEELGHCEWVLGICKSKAVESITVPNTAVLVGLLNPELPKVIRTGLDVIKPNAKKGFLLLTAACYGGDETENSARVEAKYYNRLGLEVTRSHCPELTEYMFPLPLLVNNETKLFEFIRPHKKH